MRGLFVLLCCTFFIPSCFSQTVIEGKVVNTGGHAVSFAHIIALPSQQGVSADEYGNFSLRVSEELPTELFVSAIGYKSQRIRIDANTAQPLSVILTPLAQQIDEVVVTGTLYPMQSLDSPIKTQVVTTALLDQIPTSSVVENLNFVNGVQEVIACGVCGTNDIHLNGMEGAYTLVLIDGMPIMSSLAAVYGLNGIPKSMVEQIEIIKGPASTQYGSEAMGGVINIVTKNPENAPRLSLIQSASSHAEFNSDISVSGKVGKKMNWLMNVNSFRNSKRLDYNQDFFTDIPLNNRLSVFTKGVYTTNSGKPIDISLRYYHETRFGGQLNWTTEDIGSNHIYGEYIQTRRYEAIGAVPIGNDWKLNWSLNRHEQRSYYGDVNFNALQQVGFLNILRQLEYSGHRLLLGFSQKLTANTDNSPIAQSGVLYSPGLFIQDLYEGFEHWSLLGGLRVDYHKAHGWVWSPRLSIKRDLPHDFVLRLNTGTGFRVVNLFTEDHAALSGSRRIIIEEELNPERSVHTSLNLHHIHAFKNSYATMDVDAFFTGFSNQIIPDYHTDPDAIVYRNLDGYGQGVGLGVDYAHYWNSGIQLSIGATYMRNTVTSVDVEGTSVTERILFSPDFSATASIGFKLKRGIDVDYSALIMGSMKLPEYAPPYERSQYSPWYSLHHVQLNKQLGDFWKISLAVKNLFNYTQESPLINPENPFSELFDTSYAYGPLQPRRMVLTINYTLNRP